MVTGDITKHQAQVKGREHESFWKLLKYCLNPFDGRFEDLWLPGTNLSEQVLHDLIAGLIIATIAIPVAMGFAIASGLHPVQGIVGGAVAGGMGALVGGSKYQVYGPTAAFIPMIMALIHEFSGGDPNNYFYAHGCLVFCSILAGIVIICLGLLQLGTYVQKVPSSIVVGFTVGIAAVIFVSELGDILGLHDNVPASSAGKVIDVVQRYSDYNWYCVCIGMMTFVLTKVLVRISVFIPGPIVSIAIGILLTEFVWPDKGIVRVVDKYGPIPTDLLRFTPPIMPPTEHVPLVAKAVLSIVFVSVIESLLCSRLADKLANNTRQPFHPNKELWGQGWVQIVVPMLNGFPHTGALARTATNVKVGAVSPLAGLFKCILKLLLAYLTTPILNVIPMACVGGILAYVAVNMVKVEEINEVLHTRDFRAVLVMMVTALAVFFKDFLSGITAGLALHLVLQLLRPTEPQEGRTAEKAELLVQQAEGNAAEEGRVHQWLLAGSEAERQGPMAASSDSVVALVDEKEEEADDHLGRNSYHHLYGEVLVGKETTEPSSQLASGYSI